LNDFVCRENHGFHRGGAENAENEKLPLCKLCISAVILNTR
jgi:hypothetical protein